MSKPCYGPGMTSPSEVRRNRVKKGIFSGIPEAVRHERESKSTFFLYFAENFIFYECVSLVRGAQR